MRDVESLCEEAGLGQVSKSTASRLCRELKERFQAFRERDLSSLRLVCLFLDAILLPVRPPGAEGGRAPRLGISEGGERVLLALMAASHNHAFEMYLWPSLSYIGIGCAFRHGRRSFSMRLLLASEARP